MAAKGLLVMDVDSTLIEEEVIDLLGEKAGVGDKISEITAAAMSGEIDFKESLRERVALLSGLPTTIFDDVYKEIHLTKGATGLIETLHAKGWKVGLVSGGFHEIVDKIARDLKVQEVVLEPDIAKVSIVGVGMRYHSGVAAKVFKILSREDIDVQMIATSEIKISVVIARKYCELAVRSLHDAFTGDVQVEK